METARFLLRESEIFRSLEDHNYELFASELEEAPDTQVYFWKNYNESNMGRLATIVVPNEPGTIISLGRCDKNRGEDPNKVLGSAGNIRRVFLDRKFWTYLNIDMESFQSRISRRHVVLAPKGNNKELLIKRPDRSAGKVIVGEEYPHFLVQVDLKKGGSYSTMLERNAALALEISWNRGIYSFPMPIGMIVPQSEGNFVMLSFFPATAGGYHASTVLLERELKVLRNVWSFRNMSLKDS